MYELPGKTEPLAFQLNHPLFFTVDMVGALVNSPSGVGCETYVIENDQVESRSDHLTLPCSYTCVTGKATYVLEHLGRDCPLRLVRSIQPSLVMDAFLVDHQAHCQLPLRDLRHQPRRALCLGRSSCRRAAQGVGQGY